MAFFLKNETILLNFILTIDRLKRVSISPNSHSKASDDRWNSSATRLEHSVERRRILNSSVALNWACLLMWSSPCTITNFLDSSRTPTVHNIQTNQTEVKLTSQVCTRPIYLSLRIVLLAVSMTKWNLLSRKCFLPSTTLSGCKSLGVLLVKWNVFCAFQIKRPRFTGRATWK